MKCSIDFRFSEERREEAVRFLLTIAAETEARRGCRSCFVAVDAKNSLAIHYREEWDSESAFRRHVRSETFRQLLIMMDLCEEEPRVVVEVLSWHSGLSSLRTLRSEDVVAT